MFFSWLHEPVDPNLCVTLTLHKVDSMGMCCQAFIITVLDAGYCFIVMLLGHRNNQGINEY